MTERIRQRELERVEQAIAAALDGERWLVVVVGDATSGRRHLLEEAAAGAVAHGAAVAAAKGHEAAVSEIGRVADDLGLTGPDTAATVLVLDDAQWADPTSIGLLQRALATGSGGIAIVLGYEPTEGVQALALNRLRSAAERSGSVDELALAPLTSAELAPIAQADVAERLAGLTGGSYDDVDRLIEEWLDAGLVAWTDGSLEAVQDLPERWESGKGVRPNELEPQPRKMIEAVSLAGRPIPLDVAADLIGGTSDDALAVGEQLIDRGLLVQSTQGFAAPSASDAARVAHSLGAVRAGHLYGELARAFAAAGYATRAPGLVGGYHLKAGDAEAAIPLLDKAMTQAIAAGAPAEAVPLIESALGAIEEDGVGTPELEGRLRLERAKYYQTAGWSDLAAEDLMLAMRKLEGAARVDALGYLAAVEDNRQESQTAEVFAAAGIAEATAIDEPLKAGSLLMLQARILQRIGFPIETDASLAKGGAILEEGGNPVQRLLAAQNTGRIALDRGRAAAAEPLFDRVFARAEETLGPAAKADAAAWLARAQFLHAHPDAGKESVRIAMELAEETASSGPIFLGHMAHSEGAGRFAAYQEALDAADAMLGYVLQQLPDWENAARYLRARALLGLGRPDEALAEIDRAMELSPEGINGWRWRLRIEAFRFAVLAALGAEWPKERGEDLTDELLQGQWLDVAAELMAVRAGVEADQELARQGAALGLQLGIPTTAAVAIEAVRLWSDPAAAAVAARIKETERHVPPEWHDDWVSQPEIAAALATPEVEDEALVAAASTLQGDLDAAMVTAGLADPDTTLSPAQRRQQGLVRRRPGRVRRTALWLGAAAAVIVLAIAGGAIAATVFAPEQEPEAVVQTTTAPTTTIPGIEQTQITELPAGFGGFWETWGGNQARSGSVNTNGVLEPAGYYWRDTSSRSEFFASPIVLGQRVVIGGLDGNVYFYERRGGPSSRQATGDSIRANLAGAPLSAESDTWVAFVPSSDGFLYVYDTNRGALLWRHEIDATGTPAIDVPGSEVYVGGSDGFISVLRLGQTDDLLYRLPVDDEEGDGFGGPITTSLTLEGRKLFFGVGEQLWTVDLSTRMASECDLTAIGRLLTPVVSDGMVYVATSLGWVHEVEAATCTWTQRNIAVDDALSAKPAVADGWLYQPSRFGVTAYDLSDPSEVAWNGPRFEGELFAAPVEGSPAVANGVVYVGSTDGFVYALDATTGDTLWAWDEGDPIASEVAVTTGVVYAATSGGSVVAIAPDADAQAAAPAPAPTTTTVAPPTTAATGEGGEAPPTTAPGRKGGGGGGTL